MSSNSSIEWTESTWNPITGCTKISDGCKNCYAERMAKRLKAMGQTNYQYGFKLTLHPHVMNLPLSWKNPQMVFVNSMSDLFHEEVPLDFIRQVFEIMRQAYWHQFQILTKRAERMFKLSNELDWPENVWMGVSVESQKYVDRIEMLRNTGAHIKFISFEPLIDEIEEFTLENIDWVIVGGESGPGARPIKKIWAQKIRDYCIQNRTPFFFKQWGGFNKKKSGRLLDGKLWQEMPVEKHIMV